MTTPHWALLGRATQLRPGAVHVHGAKLALFRDARGAIAVAPDACPHRGASLTASGITVVDGCVKCPYHGLAVKGLYRVVEDAVGDAWMSVADAAGAPPPPPPEFLDPAYRTIAYVKDLPGVNPVLMTENTIDHAHLAHVHRVHFVKDDPYVTVHDTGNPEHGLAVYEWPERNGYRLVIENEYRLPFTTSLRFIVTDVATGERQPALVLGFTVTPQGEAGSRQGEAGSRQGEAGCRLHLRIARGVLRCAALDGLFKLVDELPLAEDADLVRAVDPAQWSWNRLTADDAFVRQYRGAMTAAYPGLLRAYVS
jgi:phenylpropionate dioxygenase-like ring-hydroxylating dioxygenase large terminal subunit